MKLQSIKTRISRIFFGLFLVLYSFTQTPLYHLTGLPVLLEHYQEHSLQNNPERNSSHTQTKTANAISFLDFLELHYFGSEANLHPEHQPLPFKSVNINFHSIFCGELEFFHITRTEQPFQLSFKYQGDYYYPSGLECGVWHPPKHA
jgi:hypothetical protein